MRLYIIIEIISGSLMIISFGASFLLDKLNYSLFSSIFVGVFTGSIISLITAFVSYRIERRNALLGYLGGLQAYRARFTLLYNNLTYNKEREDLLEQNVIDLKLHFYDLHYNSYLKIEHIFKKRKLPKKLDKIFQITSNVQENINRNDFNDLEQMKKDIDCGICKLEAVLRDLGYLRENKSIKETKSKKEKKD